MRDFTTIQRNLRKKTGGPLGIDEVGQETKIIDYGDQDATEGDTNAKVVDGRLQSELR